MWRVTVWNIRAGYSVSGDGKSKVKAMHRALRNAEVGGVIFDTPARQLVWDKFYQCVGNIVCNGYSSYATQTDGGNVTVEVRKLNP